MDRNNFYKAVSNLYNTLIGKLKCMDPDCVLESIYI
jgi:hypothetical protein